MKVLKFYNFITKITFNLWQFEDVYLYKILIIIKKPQNSYITLPALKIEILNNVVLAILTLKHF